MLIFNKQVRRFLWGALLSLVFVTPAQTAEQEAEPAALTEDYIVRQWGVGEGVPEAIVMHVTQAPDGFLWVTTPTRIARFDGQHFVSLGPEDMPPQLPTLLRGIHFAPGGCFWVYGDRGAWCYDGQHWQEITEKLEDRKITLLLDEPGGAVICVATRFLYRVVGTTATIHPFPGEGIINGAAFDSRGVLRVAADDGIYQFNAGEFEKEATPLDPDRFSIVQTAPSGTVLAKGRKGFIIWSAGTWQKWERRDILYPRKIHSDTVLMESEDDVWVAGSVVGHLQGSDYKELGRRNGYVTSTACHIFKDRSGSIWLATRGGLYQFTPRTVRLVHNTTGVGSDTFLAIMKNSDGSILCGVDGCGILQGEPEALQPLELDGFPSYAAVSALLTGRDNTLWIGTKGDFLWYREANTGLLKRNVRTDESISTLLEARDGTLYAGTWAGLRQVDGERASSLRLLGGMPHAAVHALLQDRAGMVWVGHQHEGLAGFAKTGRVVRVSMASGLPDSSVRALCEDPVDGLWIGTPKGLVWKKNTGDLFVFGENEGLPETDIRQILDDGAGGLWLSTAAGITRIERADAEAITQARRKTLRVREYGIPEGLISEESPAGYGHTSVMLNDGRLLFCTLQGLAILSPNVMPETHTAVAQVERIATNDQKIWTRRMTTREAAPEVGLPAGTRSLAISYVVPEYRAPGSIRFRHQLEGFDAEWSESTDSHTARYQNLLPGTYTFRLSMRLRNGDWADQGRLATLVLPALFYQTLSFRLLLFIGGLVLVAAAVWDIERRRNLRRIIILENEQAIAQERSRIARDLHDDIGAALTRVAILGNLTQADAGDEESTRSHGRELFNTAQRMTRSLREIVWALSPRSSAIEDYINFMTQYAQQFLRESGLHCRLDIPENIPGMTVDARARHASLMAFKEALNNAVKHAGATGLTVRFAVERHVLRVSVEDEGCGMEYLEVERSAGHGHGIETMRQRMRDCGGRFELISTPGQGTAVVLQVPLTK